MPTLGKNNIRARQLRTAGLAAGDGALLTVFIEVLVAVRLATPRNVNEPTQSTTNKV